MGLCVVLGVQCLIPVLVVFSHCRVLWYKSNCVCPLHSSYFQTGWGNQWWWEGWQERPIYTDGSDALHLSKSCHPEFMQGSICFSHLCIPRNIDTKNLHMNMNTLKWARVKRVWLPQWCSGLHSSGPCSLFPAVFVNISMPLFLYNERVITVRPLVATYSQVYTLWWAWIHLLTLFLVDSTLLVHGSHIMMSFRFASSVISGIRDMECNAKLDPSWLCSHALVTSSKHPSSNGFLTEEWAFLLFPCWLYNSFALECDCSNTGECDMQYCLIDKLFCDICSPASLVAEVENVGF